MSIDVALPLPPDGPVETVAASGPTPLLLICDHARNRVPADVAGGDLGLPPSEMGRHIAYDIGARGLTLALAHRLGAGAVLSTFSRLVIDPNRGADDPTLLMRIYDGTIIPANRHADAAEVARRRALYWQPYHDAIDATIDAMLATGRTPHLIAVHSYTPQLVGRPPRPWHVGVLWDKDDRVARPLITALEAEGDLVVGENQPYTGQIPGDSMWTHGSARGLPHVLLEVRHDLIVTPAQQEAWADRLARILPPLVLTEAAK